MSVALYFLLCYITLPRIDTIYNYKPMLTSKFYDANGSLIYEIGSERRTHIDINKVPKMLIYAFISAEDKTFYTNPGFDPYGLARTILQDIVKFLRGQKLGGASTITQQVVKNIMLSNERTITRKIKELFLSYRLSKLLSKDAIMELYLNHIYLGMQAYGVVSASDEYFGKSVSQLTVPEMALLAAMPKAPSSINPFKNYNRAVARRNWVLLRMMEDGYITQDQYDQYSKTELIVRRRHNTYAPFYAPSFFAQSLLVSKATGLTRNDLLNDGYDVRLTIDGDLQKIAQEALNRSLELYSKKHGFTGPLFSFDAQDVSVKTPGELLRSISEPENLNRFLLAVVTDVKKDRVLIGLRDNSTGEILLNDLQWARQKLSETEVSDVRITKCDDVLRVGDVIVVGRKTEDSQYYTLEQLPQINGGVLAINPQTGAILAMVGGYADLAGSLNRTVQAFRQMGSTIKPFVYGTALENGFTPSSIFMDTDININLGDGIVWTPANDSKRTHGPTTLRVGLEKSRNTVTVRIAEAVGMKKIVDKIVKSGLNKKPQNNLSVALGSVESNLLDIGTAYSAFINNGIVPKPYLIEYVRRLSDRNAEINGMDMDNDDEENNLDKDNKLNVLNRIYFTNCDINAVCKLDVNDAEKQTEASNYAKNTMQDVDKIKTTEASIDKQQHTRESDKLFTPEVSYQIISILQGAVKHGTSYRLAGLNLPIASKTGTSNDGKDLWNIVLSPELVLVAYVGYDIPIGTGNFGSQYALPINKEILANLPDKYKITDFKTPENIRFIKVNRLTGKPTHNDSVSDDVIFEAFKEDDEVLDVEEHGNIDSANTSDIDITQIDV